MDTNEVNIAFDILLEELETVVNGLNEDGAKAFQSGDHGRARELLGQATTLTEFHEKVQRLQAEWQRVSAGEVSHRRKARRKTRSRLSRGLRTPENAFRRPILEALVELGGSASLRKVLQLVGQKMKGVLNEHDRERLTSGPTHEVRWRNTAMWTRYKMVREGLLKCVSPRGVWEITSKGRQVLKRKPPVDRPFGE